MERQTKLTVCIFLIIFLIAAIAPASAASFSFVDSSYLGQNDYTITDNYGTTVANFTGDSTVTLNGGRSYTVNYHPRGLFDFSEQQPGNLTYPVSVIDFLSENLPGIICLAGCLFIAAKWRGHS